MLANATGMGAAMSLCARDTMCSAGMLVPSTGHCRNEHSLISNTSNATNRDRSVSNHTAMNTTRTNKNQQ